MSALNTIADYITKHYHNNDESSAYVSATDTEMIDEVKSTLNYYRIVNSTDYNIEGDRIKCYAILCGDTYEVTITEYAPAEFASCSSDDIEYLITTIRL